MSKKWEDDKILNLPDFIDGEDEPIDLDALDEAQEEGRVFGVYQQRMHLPKEWGNFSIICHRTLCDFLVETPGPLVRLFFALVQRQRWMGFCDPVQRQVAVDLQLTDARVSALMKELKALSNPRVIVEINAALAEEIRNEWSVNRGRAMDETGDRLLNAAKAGGPQATRFYLLRPDLAAMGRIRDIKRACAIWLALTGEEIVSTWPAGPQRRAAEQEGSRIARDAQRATRAAAAERRRADLVAVRARKKAVQDAEKWLRMKPETKAQWVARAESGMDKLAEVFIAKFLTLQPLGTDLEQARIRFAVAEVESLLRTAQGLPADDDRLDEAAAALQACARPLATIPPVFSSPAALAPLVLCEPPTLTDLLAEVATWFDECHWAPVPEELLIMAALRWGIDACEGRLTEVRESLPADSPGAVAIDGALAA
jgi:hypothetical protein